MKTKIRPLGSSNAIIIPKKIMEEAALKEGSSVTVVVKKGKVIISKSDNGIERFFGILSKEEGKSLDRHLTKIKDEWQRTI